MFLGEKLKRCISGNTLSLVEERSSFYEKFVSDGSYENEMKVSEIEKASKY
jgi:hypothetical protein